MSNRFLTIGFVAATALAASLLHAQVSNVFNMPNGEASTPIRPRWRREQSAGYRC